MFDFLWVTVSRVWEALRPGHVKRDFERELTAHLEMLTQEHLRRGELPEEARRRARLDLGGVHQLVETHHDHTGLPMFETFWQDVRYAVRMLRKRAGFTLIAMLTLALGIGANTAIFSVVNAIFLRPLPFRDASRIYVVRRTGNRFGGPSLSMPIFLGWQKEQDLFDHLALYGWRSASTLTGNGEAEPIATAGVSIDLLSVFGVQPTLGRGFRPEEGRPGGPNVVILSDGLWRTRFQANPNVLGTSITLESGSYTVIGVLPAGFELPIPVASHADLWLPIRVPLTSDNPSNGGLLCLALLKSGVTPRHAEEALTPTLDDLRGRFPNMFSRQERAYLEPLRSFITSRAGTVPLLMFGAVALVLLVACANVANLMLAASTGRQREVALRTAMGAGRRRIMRQLLTESVLLAVAGGVLGVAVCYGFFNAILALVPADTPHVGDFQIDGAVLTFALLLSVLTGILFGFAPAFGASSLDLNAVFKKTSVQTGSGRHGRLRSALAVNEVAVSLVLLIGAALALRSLNRLMTVQPGFDPEQVLTFRIEIPARKYPTPSSRTAFFEAALDRMAALPGVTLDAVANVLPFQGGGDTLFSIEGNGGSQPQVDRGGANVRVISPRYFSTLRIPVDRGRVFDDADNVGAAPVVVINRAMANAYWPGRDPIGQRIWIGKPMGPENSEPAPRQIVGVVGDIREASLAEPPDVTLYIPYAQHPSATAGSFIVSTVRLSVLSVPDVRAAIRGLDPDLPLTNILPLQNVVSASIVAWRFRAILLGTFGALALFIAAIGVYGVISYSVANRTQEIGLRMALGARRKDVLALVLWEGMRTTFAGIAIGLAASYGLTRLMANLLYGVSATDPFTFASIAALLVVVALTACYVPVRRALRIDPMSALRCE